MNRSKRSIQAPRSQGDLCKFISKTSDEISEDFVGGVLASGSNVEFRVIQFRVAWEVVCVLDVLVVVESLTEHLQSGVAFADNAEAQFVLFSKEQFHRHDDQFAHWPTCFEPSPKSTISFQQKKAP